MRKIFLVAQREFLSNVTTKAFWIGILVFPLILLLALAAPVLLERTRGVRTYAVIDRSGWLLDAVERQAAIADLAQVLAALRERAPGGGEGMRLLPDPVRPLAPVLLELPEERLPLLAQALVDGLDTKDAKAEAASELPPPAREAVRRQRERILAWWRELPPQVARELARGTAKARYQRVSLDGEVATEQALAHKVAAGELFAYFVIGPDPVGGSEGAKYVSKNLTDQDLREWFGRVASDVVRARRLQREAIDPAIARWIQEPVRFEPRRVTAAGEEAGVEARDALKQWAPVGFVYLLWISVFSVSQMLLTNTIEEKSSRVIEMLLSSVSPVQLMAGKITGIAATGLTVVGTWVLAFVVGTRYVPGLLGAPARLDLSGLANDPLYLGSFLAYFLLGYLFYAALLVGVGSVCNTLKEAQNLMTPVMLLLVVPLLLMMPIGRDPSGTLARVLSFVPPFTPFVMMNRAAGPPSVFEYVVTTLLLAASIVGALWAGAKVFRIGILLTGKPPTIREILRWIRAPVGLIPARRAGPA